MEFVPSIVQNSLITLRLRTGDPFLLPLCHIH